MKVNEYKWYDEKIMGEARRKSIKKFSKGSIRFLSLSE